MNFKRGLITASVAIASVAALVGCSTGGSTPAETEAPVADSINYWYWQDDTTDTTIADLAADFKEETGITVNIQDDIAQPDFYDSLVNAIAAGNAPDATHLNTNMFGQLVAADVLAPLNDYIDGWKGKDDIVPSTWSYVQNADASTTFALPNKFLMFYMYYRTDLFKAAGVEVPETQKEFVEAAKKLTNPAANQYGFDIRGGANGQDQWAAFLSAGGMKFLDDKGEVAFDSADTKSSNDLYISTYPYAPPGAINDGFAQIIANFQAGTAAMIINHLGAAKTLEASNPDQVGVALIPSKTGDPKKTTYMGTMNANAVLSGSDDAHKAAAFKWISYLAEAKAQEAITLSTNGYLPVVQSVLDDPQFDDNQYIQVSKEAAAGTTQAWPSITGTTVATQKTWQPLFQGALLGQNENDAVVEGVADSLANG